MIARTVFAGLALSITLCLIIGDAQYGIFGPARAQAQAEVRPIDPGATHTINRNGSIMTPQGSATVFNQLDNDVNLMVPDTRGGYILVPGGARPTPSPAMVEAQELKLRLRELASQLLETWPGQPLTGVVALPTSFVALDNFNETSQLGRYIAESMFYEFNTRGFATREYRTNGSINMVAGQGEFALSRALPDVKVSSDWAALLVGTYYKDQGTVFINARLVRPSDGLVLRTGQIILPMNSLVARMTAQPRKPPFASRTMPIVQGARR